MHFEAVLPELVVCEHRRTRARIRTSTYVTRPNVAHLGVRATNSRSHVSTGTVRSVHSLLLEKQYIMAY